MDVKTDLVVGIEFSAVSLVASRVRSGEVFAQVDHAVRPDEDYLVGVRVGRQGMKTDRRNMRKALPAVVLVVSGRRFWPSGSTRKMLRTPVEAFQVVPSRAVALEKRRTEPSGAKTGFSLTGHTCARLASGDVSCWGNGGATALGRDVSGDAYATPGLVEGVSGAAAVAVGSGFTCFLLGTGGVSCVGVLNADVEVGLGPAAGVAVGGRGSCALLMDGSLWCWGEGFAPLPGMQGLSSAVTGLDLYQGFLCTVRSWGQLFCEGNNDYGQVGDGTTTFRAMPVAVDGIGDATQVTTGLRHACALHATGAVSCWGDNLFGQLGDGTWVPSSVPRAVGGVANAVEIAAGMGHTCARTDDGMVLCWGKNVRGELGDGTLLSDRSTTPVTALPP